MRLYGYGQELPVFGIFDPSSEPERSPIMKKTLLILVATALALLILGAGLFAQKKPDVIGTWIGYAVVGDGSRGDITLVIDKGEAGDPGKLTDTTGLGPESHPKG